MTINEMDNLYLVRLYIQQKRELKTISSTIKQIEDELNSRFDKGKLSDCFEDEKEKEEE